jgi:hypothetical protein
MADDNNFSALITEIHAYDGTECPSLHAWFTKIEDIATLAGLNDKEKCLVAKMKLTGQALLFKEGNLQLESVKKWKEFKAIMQERFEPDSGKHFRLAMFSQLTQKETESVMDFATRLKHAAIRLHIPASDESVAQKDARIKLINEKCLTQFLIGLKDKEIKKVVFSEETFANAVKVANSEEEMLKFLNMADEDIAVAAVDFDSDERDSDDED